MSELGDSHPEGLEPQPSNEQTAPSRDSRFMETVEGKELAKKRELLQISKWISEFLDNPDQDWPLLAPAYLETIIADFPELQTPEVGELLIKLYLHGLLSCAQDAYEEFAKNPESTVAAEHLNGAFMHRAPHIGGTIIKKLGLLPVENRELIELLALQYQTVAQSYELRGSYLQAAIFYERLANSEKIEECMAKYRLIGRRNEIDEEEKSSAEMSEEEIKVALDKLPAMEALTHSVIANEDVTSSLERLKALVDLQLQKLDASYH